MQKLQLESNITLYRFRKYFQLNILALRWGKQVLLMDSGLSPHGQAVATDLAQQGLQVRVIVNSHFHRDHINGNRFFPQAEIWGSASHADANHKQLAPDRLLHHGDEAVFGDFKLRFVAAPGHCKHQQVTIINEQAAFLGDLLMTAYDGIPWIPYIAPDGSIDRYLEDLVMIENLAVPTLIPAHGLLLTPELRQTLIDIYRHYLQRVQQLGPGARIEDCLENYETIIHAWHQKNLDNIFLQS